MLLRAAEAGIPSAAWEVVRRHDAGSHLEESQADALAELALRWRRQSVPGRRGEELLVELDERGLLTAEQRNLLFSGFVQASLSVRRKIRQGDPLVLRLGLNVSSLGYPGYVFWHGVSAVLAGDSEIFNAPWDAWRSTRGEDWRSVWGAPTCDNTLILPQADLPIGAAQVDYVGRHVVLSQLNRSDSSPEADVPWWSKEITLTKGMEVLPADAPDPVRWIIDPEAERQLGDAIDVCVWVWWPDECYSTCISEKEVVDGESAPLERAGSYEVAEVHVGLRDSAPIPVAFDLVIEADGLEVETTTDVKPYRPGWSICSEHPGLVWNKEEPWDANVTVTVPSFTANEIYVILRGSRDVARRTVDLYEVWQGELRYGPFPVKHLPPKGDCDGKP